MFFMDVHGLILSHPVPAGTTVNAAYNQKVICQGLTQALRRKRLDMVFEELIYHQDNAPAHRAVETLDTIDFLGMEWIPNAPYSLDLALMDFALFLRLKAELCRKRFADLDDLHMGVLRVVSTYKKS